MRVLLAAAMLSMLAGAAESQHCSGQVVQRPNKNGVMRDVCLDGKYSTCVRDGRQGGWTEAEAKAYCDRLKDAGRIK